MSRLVFTVQMQQSLSTRKPVRLSVGPSVCPTVKRVDCDKTEERAVQIFIPYDTKDHLA